MNVFVHLTIASADAFCLSLWTWILFSSFLFLAWVTGIEPVSMILEIIIIPLYQTHMLVVPKGPEPSLFRLQRDAPVACKAAALAIELPTRHGWSASPDHYRRTCISSFVVRCSVPLNYKPASEMVRLSDLNWKRSSATYLSERKGNEHVTLTPGRIGWPRDSNPVLHIHHVALYLLSQGQHKHPAASRGRVFSFSATNILAQPYGSRIIDPWLYSIRCCVILFFAAGDFFYNKYQQYDDKNDVNDTPPFV